MAQMVLALTWIAGVAVVLTAGGSHLYVYTGLIWIGRYALAWWQYHAWTTRPVYRFDVMLLACEITFAAGFWTILAITGF
jgi:hypothetical protein